MKKPNATQAKWPQFLGPNLGYVEEQYEKFLENPQSVDEELRLFFEENEFSIDVPKAETVEAASPSGKSFADAEIVAAALRFAENIRSSGHLAANIHPLEKNKKDLEFLEPEYYKLSVQDLQKLPAKLLCSDAPEGVENGWDAVQHLKKVYTDTIAFEFQHVHNMEEHAWLNQKVESGSLIPSLNKEKRTSLLKRLTEVAEFEKFLHRTFVGQKRFSIEGLDTMVPLLDEMISDAVQDGAKTINIGMAHRGRLNVLAHVLGKPYEMIFAEFQHAPNKELVPSEGSIGISFGWTGDVKYHLGLDKQIKSDSTANARLTLANNPSHLEFVGAVVEGFTRAVQDDRTEPGFPKYDPSRALAILIHGDAAFPGQGIVAETLNLSKLEGYRTGGTIHIIANNTIGFTTDPIDSRSTRYSSDLAKGYEIPILHVNADDPEACVSAARLAAEYRAKFQKDFLIDLIGYRRFGHNEMDEPMTTNPLMYRLVHNHPTVKTLYGEKLEATGVLSEQDISEITNEVGGRLQAAHEKVPSKKNQELRETDPPEVIEKGFPVLDTAVSLEKLKGINTELLQWPDNFKVFGKLERILKRRESSLSDGGKVDWALAEALAFATIISDGTPLRLSGQDSERGTFAQRNLVLHDSETGRSFSPLHTFPSAKSSFAVHNSPLSEGSVLGFEYGYNVFSPETLVLWEAQYGDFANAAQVIFDQFIAAGRAKWGQKSGLVMLLPHAYEGQGPEHSSGRVERFLTLAAENNWTVANLSTAAQYFHILRRQAAILKRDEVRPLVLMTPKSLLRNPSVASEAAEFSEGRFNSIIEQPGLGKETEKIERVVLCTGKMAVDLDEAVDTAKHDWLHILRIEEIYPFPLKQLKEKLNQYPNLKEIVWVQEEPKNMGAWTFVEPRINEATPDGLYVSYIGRRRRSSPAEGDPNVHKHDQSRIINEALTKH
ncbi:2-oxoglutarate dehydrogenase E1 component [Mesobacillus harenae]|uniref:2-oxoglutarate dehydrogenase E1 component n=1 Tax=Mesobacillus harenae TaxID=2213203 RepID=UPI0015808F1D|nr:2-oxoglutarate dehydrogenase E1 component [Mesobacillus harenae]